MDELSEDSPWLPLVLASDLADRLRHGPALSVLTICVVFTFFSFLGSWLDLLLTLTFLLRNSALLTSWLRNLTTVQTAVSFVLVVLASWLIFSLVRPALFSKDVVAWKGPGRPYMIPCRTSHTRVFPQKHSFTYSYLAVGAPVGYQGNVNGLVSIDQPTQCASWLVAGSSTRGWYDINALDYLQRGHNDLGLRGKLDDFLKSQVRCL